MTQARKRLVSIDDTPYYHCIGRCVRRAFLCGIDSYSGQNYEHRRQWVLERLQQLSQIFAIDVCSYAVMSNHYHVILKLNPDELKDWDNMTVVKRWHQLFSGNEYSRSFEAGELLSPMAQMYINTMIPIWRDRLCSLSWFMRCLNEYIARKANTEDDCTGRFWEGRFKSQALLDEAALTACMAYVDLNPIRAGLAMTPEGSDYTSIQERIRQHMEPKQSSNWLVPMTGNSQTTDGLPMELLAYLSLVDWTGRASIQNKKGSIASDIPSILNRLNIEPTVWLNNQRHFGKKYYRAVGSRHSIQVLASKVGLSWLNGQGRESAFGFN